MTKTYGQVRACISISTHTLTWSVTHSQRKEDVSVTNFNSHAHVERDWITAWARHELFNFNSHAHVERDGAFKIGLSIIKISTHTLTWSVT